jgi:sn-glycerol 3-phosphate transport system substrate-binding protein
MKRAILAAVTAAMFFATIGVASAEPIELQWWHAMTAANAAVVNQIAADFNAAQSEYKIVPVFKGSYAETMTAGIAAYRAGKGPDIIQIFEVGTATMMAATGAVMPVYQLMKDAGEPFDPNAYLPAVTGYYSTADGRMLSLPFNSSTAIVYWNKALFRRAGFDPDKPPKTWPETFAVPKSCAPPGYPAALPRAGSAGPSSSSSAPGTISPLPARPTGSTAPMPGSNSTIRRLSVMSPISQPRKRTRALIMAGAPASPRASS